MNKAPITWSRGTWDYGIKENMGYDAIPTIYDASVSGYTDSEWKSGIGWGTDLYMSALVPSGTAALYATVTPPSGKAWHPRVDSGYFYLGQDEYYLYSDKGATSNTPTVGRLNLYTSNHRYPPPPAPVTITLGSSEFSASSPFCKMHEPSPTNSTRTPTKYRRRTDLTGRREYIASGTVADGIIPIPYTFTLGSMEFTIGSTGSMGQEWSWYIDCYPSGSSVTVEYERSSNQIYDIVDVDMNPLNSYEVANSFCVIANTTKYPVAYVEVNNGSRYIRDNGRRALLIAAVKDQYGRGISGETVTFTADWGDFSDATVDTIWDGTASTWFTTDPTVNITGVVVAECNGVTGLLWLPGGKLL